MFLTKHESQIGVSPALKEKVTHVVGVGCEVRQLVNPLGTSVAQLSTLVLVSCDDGSLVVLEKDRGYLADVTRKYLDHLIRQHEAALRGLIALRDASLNVTTM
jgi:hypothetical protein